MNINSGKKTFLYVGFYSLPDHDAAANRVYNNAKAIALGGNKVIFIDEQTEYPYDSFKKSKHVINDWDVWSQKRPKGLKNFLKKMIMIENIQYVVKQYEKVDAVIVYNYPAIALYRLRKFCSKNDICVIADCTEWYSGKEYKFPMNILCAADSWLRMVVVQKKLSGVMCISSFLYNYYKNSVKVLFVPPLVDKANSKWNQKKIEVDEDKINIVYAGNPGKSKELILPIVQGIQKSVNKHRLFFRVVGITEKQFLDLYPQAIDAIQEIKPNIEFLGRMSHKDTIRIIMSSDYMCFLRPYDRVSMAGFSTKFVESITCGTAVITNNTGDLKAFIDKIGRGYVVDNLEQLQDVFDRDFYFLKNNGENLDEKTSHMFDFSEYSEQINNWLCKCVVEE